MWSHYADCHRGFVVEIRTPFKGRRKDELYALDRLLPFPINYTDARPTVSLQEAATHDLVKKILLTKSPDWKYEEEERVVDRTRGPGVYPYRRADVLWSVIAGLRMSEDNFKMLQTLVTKASADIGRPIPFYKIHEKADTFLLTIPGHQSSDI